MIAPLTQACCHPPTTEEKRRDPDYAGCFAQPKQACVWAKRYDGVKDPPFHSERWETAIERRPSDAQLSKQAFDQAVLDSGEI